MGFFKNKEVLTNKTPNEEGIRNDRKLMFILVDGLREDFIDFGKEDVKKAIDINAPNAYHGERFQIFKKLREKYPDRTFLKPA